MRKLLAVLLLLATSALAEAPKKAMRLESVTWNPVSNRLTWVISEGRVDEDDNYTPEGRRSFYSIDVRAAVMFFDGDGRRFSREEAGGVTSLLNHLSRYALESVLWWQDGQGEPVEKKMRAEQPFLDFPPKPPVK